VTLVALGENHALALTASGEVYAWGDASYGRLGDGASGFGRLAGSKGSLLSPRAPSRGSGSGSGSGSGGGGGVGARRTPPVRLAHLSGCRVTALSAGWWHSAAVTAGGNVYTWGGGEYGQLGHGGRADEHVPRVVEGLRQPHGGIPYS
jgi:alpha-tubulin suppressor-like RCC1 family protein